MIEIAILVELCCSYEIENNDNYSNIFHLVLKASGFVQHCFFKSLQLQRSAMAFTNLGFLYYRHENLQMANKAFSSAQQTDPMYSLAWIGQVKSIVPLSMQYSIEIRSFLYLY
jgi:Tfp pilus assembly protein PilF